MFWTSAICPSRSILPPSLACSGTSRLTNLGSFLTLQFQLESTSGSISRRSEREGEEWLNPLTSLISYTAAFSTQPFLPHNSGCYSLPWLLRCRGGNSALLLFTPEYSTAPYSFHVPGLNGSPPITRCEDVVFFLLEHWLVIEDILGVKEGENRNAYLYFLVNT